MSFNRFDRDFDESLDCKTYENERVQNIMDEFNGFMKSVAGTSSSMSFISDVVGEVKEDDSKTNLMKFSHKMELNKMENKFSEKEKAYKKNQIEIELQNKSLMLENVQWKQKYEALQTKTKELRNKFFRIDSESKVMDLENKIKALQSDTFERQNEKDDKIAALQNRLSNEMNEKGNLISYSKDLKMELDQLSATEIENQRLLSIYKERANQSISLRQQKEELMKQLMEKENKVNQLQQSLNEVENTRQLTANFKKDLERLKELENATKKFEESKSLIKKQDENVMLLKEKIISLDSALGRAQSRCVEVENVKSNNMILMERIEDYERKQHDLDSHYALKNKVFELDRANAHLSEKNAELEKELSAAHRYRNKEKESSGLLRNQISKDKRRSTTQQDQVNRYRKRFELVLFERDSLRSILQSYDADLTSTTHHVQLQKRLKTVNEANEKRAAYVQELEERLQQYQQGGVPTEESSSRQTSCQNCPIITHEKENLKELVNSHAETIEKLQQKMDIERLKGDFNPDSTKVLHFRMNPVDSARAEDKKQAEELKKENLHLQQKLKELQQGHDVSMSEIMMSRAASEKLKLAELRMERVKEALLKKNCQLRQACWTLFGYRIDNALEGQYKVLSMYAESEHDYLLFKDGDDGDMELIETDLSKKLGQLMQLHLHQQQSIPMFLCALSIELFGDQTIY